ncbi:MAG TPA: hypothetical protein VN999_03425, partial [Thermoanaerobaculia bacterium]|nr:hypothetical protein [Thermoanaerobaculia bacterium]
MGMVAWESDPLLGSAMLDAADDFQAATFNLMHGYYKQSIGALRTAVEVVMLAATCRIEKKEPRPDVSWDPIAEWKKWEMGSVINFSVLHHRLSDWGACHKDKRRREAVSVSEAARLLYRRLSEYIHARSTCSNAALWESNGPIWHPAAFAVASDLQIDTYCVLYRLVKLARPRFRVEDVIRKEIAARGATSLE